MSEATAIKYYLKNRLGNREITKKEIESMLGKVGMEYAAEFIIRDIEAGVNYTGADYIITIKP